MPDVFLSYASPDRERIVPVVEALKRHGWTVWWDRQILPGQTWESTIEEALNDSRCVVVVWSKSSVTSEWVRIEATLGRDRGIVAPIVIETVDIPFAFRQIQTASLIDWDGTDLHPGILGLQAGIHAILTGPGPGAATKQPLPLTEERALDAAMRRELPVQEPANLIAMVRRAHSEGLKGMLATDDEYNLTPDDVVSKAVDITFPVDAGGHPLPAEILVRVTSPGFEPASQEKRVRLLSHRDSSVSSFLLRPLEVGNLVVQLDVYQRDACVASRLIRSNGIPSGRMLTLLGHIVVSLPLSVNVTPGQFQQILAAAAGAPPPKPSPSPGEFTRMMQVPQAAPGSSAPSPGPGEFTQVFGKAFPPPDPTPATPPDSPSVTQTFQSPSYTPGEPSTTITQREIPTYQCLPQPLAPPPSYAQPNFPIARQSISPPPKSSGSTWMKVALILVGAASVLLLLFLIPYVLRGAPPAP